MARWRLTDKHYLKVPGTEWDYKEQDLATGRMVRRVFEVPLYLDPDDPLDWTDKAEGWIVVCYKGKGKPRDLVFEGKPTRDMEPLDDEAVAISEAESPNWVHPIESLPTQQTQSMVADDIATRIVQKLETRRA